jgi:hypothetical protein
MLDKLLGWFSSRRRKPLSELLAVQFDDVEVHVVVLEKLDLEWNQTFAWADIKRVCFKDEGIYSSDRILIELAGHIQLAVVLTEAKGGTEFLGALTDRGYFPEEVWRRAIGETGGGMHCWPPLEKDAS